MILGQHLEGTNIRKKKGRQGTNWAVSQVVRLKVGAHNLYCERRKMVGRLSPLALPLLALTASLQLIPASAFAPTAAPRALFAARGATVCAGSSQHAILGGCGAALLRANPLQRLGGHRCERAPHHEHVSRCRVRCRRAIALSCTGDCADLTERDPLEAGRAPGRCGGMGLLARAPCSPGSSKRLARCDCQQRPASPTRWLVSAGKDPAH